MFIYPIGDSLLGTVNCMEQDLLPEKDASSTGEVEFLGSRSVLCLTVVKFNKYIAVWSVTNMAWIMLPNLLFLDVDLKISHILQISWPSVRYK